MTAAIPPTTVMPIAPRMYDVTLLDLRVKNGSSGIEPSAFLMSFLVFLMRRFMTRWVCIAHTAASSHALSQFMRNSWSICERNHVAHCLGCDALRTQRGCLSRARDRARDHRVA